MSWRPNSDPEICQPYTSVFWHAFEPIFDQAFPNEPLPRGDKGILTNYIVERQGHASMPIEIMRNRLPGFLRKERLGVCEIDCLDFLFNYRNDRILTVTGPRGAGKSTFIHYVDFILNQKRRAETPVLLIINGNVGESPGIREYASQFVVEMERIMGLSGLELHVAEAIRQGHAMLKDDLTRDGLIKAFQRIRDGLPADDNRGVVLVFDNLDPVPIKSVEEAIRLARDIYISCSLGSILCMRPSLFRLVGDRGGVRNFVKMFIRLPPPTLAGWLSAFPRRMCEALRAARKKDPTAFRLDGRPVTLKRLAIACRRYEDLFKERRHQDDPRQFMESVCAHDMRHLRNLIRRTLENKNLPSGWLLADQNGSRELDQERDSLEQERLNFHPMRAAIEGPYTCFKAGDSSIADILCIEIEGEVHFLLLHRLLNVLSDVTPRRTETVLKWMKAYGYERNQVIPALEYLRLLNLVYGSDLDKKWTLHHVAEFCGLTVGGQYYLHRLLSDGDYVTGVVVDIPLQHRRIRVPRHVDQFAARLHSVAELMMEVRIHENRQISDLRRRKMSEDSVVAIDRLRMGGTMLGKLLAVFRDKVETSANSRIPSLRQAYAELRELIPDFEDSVKQMEKSLLELRNQAMNLKLAAPLDATLEFSPPLPEDTDVTVVGVVGTRLTATITAPLPVDEQTARTVVLISDTASQQIVDATCLVPATDKNALIGNFKVNQPSAGEATSLKMEKVSVHLNGKVTILLTTERLPGRAAKINAMKLLPDSFENYEIGEIKDCDELTKWAQARLLTVQNELKNGRPIETSIRTTGETLAREVLSERGRNHLSQLLDQADTCLIRTTLRHVPWEWIIPVEYESSISDRCNFIRLQCASRARTAPLASDVDSRTALPFPFYTIGDTRADPHPASPEVAINKSWRKGVPPHRDICFEWLHERVDKHIIAHHENGTLCFDRNVTDDLLWYLSHEEVSSNVPVHSMSPYEIILSSCNTGAVEDPNIAAIISQSWQCRVWAPLVALSTAQAIAVDNYLMEKMQVGNPSISTVMRRERKDCPLLKTYVQYALKPN